MSKREKLKAKIISKPQDIRWAELKKFLASEGFYPRSGTSGSSRVFRHADGRRITVHKPHSNKRVSEAAIDFICDYLKLK